MEDHDACNLIAASIGSVMRQSLDDNFKEECKKLFGATNTNMVEEALRAKLLQTIQGRNHVSIQHTILTENTTTSPVTVEERSQDSNNATISPVEVTEITSNQYIPRKNNLGEMYRRTMQLHKRSLSPQPRLESKLKLSKALQSSAPI